MDPITPDLADRVLTANIRNVISKVNAGKTLSAAELKMFEAFTLEQRELHASRQAALLRKWVNGGRLTSEERTEIVDLVPGIEDPPPAASVTSTRQFYSKQQTDYAEQYGQTDRTIKRWIKVGREASPPDLPPLDVPEDMPAWWTRHMKHRVPARILELAKKAASPLPAELDHPPQSAGCDDVVTPPEAPPPPIFDEGDVGMQSMLNRMRTAERAAGEAYMQAVQARDPDPSAIEQRRRSWSEITKQLRSLENDAVKFLSAEGEVFTRADIIQEETRLHTTFLQSLRAHCQRVWPTIQAADPDRRHEVWNATLDELFETLIQSRFGETSASPEKQAA